jgi:hypothetical protein
MKVRCCLINATKPKCVTKEFSLVDGKLEKKTIASVFEGSMQVQESENASQFADFLQTLGPNQCLTYGIPPRDAQLVTEEVWINLGKPNDPLPRTQSVFDWPNGPGVLMLDYDAPKDGTEPLGGKELIQALLEACPDIKSSGLIWWPSTSSHIYSGETKITSLKGQRIYLFVKDARDIERAGKTLNERLWTLGHGRYEISVSGSLLMRSVFDGAVWQSNRIDFAAGAMCGPGLEQRRGKPKLLWVREPFVFLETREAIPALTKEEADRALVNQANSKVQLASQAEQAKDAWVNDRVKALQIRHPELDEKAAIMMARRAVDSYDLMGDWPIFIKDHEGRKKEITVLEALDKPEIYHGRLTLDPLEPDYDGGRWVGKLYLYSPRPNLNSFAHGGAIFRLHRQPARIEIVTGKGRETTDALLEVLRHSPDIFDFGEEMVRVGQVGALHPLNEHSLRYVAGGITQFWQMKKLPQGGALEVLRDPPPQVCQNALSLRAHRELKKLNGVITAPTLRPDGTVLDSPGYDLQTHLLLDMMGTPTTILTSPTRDQALVALEQLWRPFNDFPFCSNLDRAVHLAALLTTAVRSSLPSAPGFAYDAPIQGSGKTLLARCDGVLAQGTEPSVWPHTTGRDDEEIRKRIFTILRSGSRVLIWDNVVGSFDSPSMAACMTSPTITDRILGQSNSSTVPNRMMVILTGNNLTLQGEMPRRILVCRIDPGTDKPFARSFDLDPYAYCRTNRLNMITAALTLIRAFLTHGCETKITGRLASFEDWDLWVRRTVIFANELKPGMFGDVMDVIQANQSADPDQEALSSLLVSWEKEFGTKAVTVSDLLAGASVTYGSSAKTKFFESLEELTNIKRHQLTTKSVGRYLGYRKGRIAGGRLLERGPKTGDLQTWRIRVVGAVNAGGI